MVKTGLLRLAPLILLAGSEVLVCLLEIAAELDLVAGQMREAGQAEFPRLTAMGQGAMAVRGKAQVREDLQVLSFWPSTYSTPSVC